MTKTLTLPAPGGTLTFEPYSGSLTNNGSSTVTVAGSPLVPGAAYPIATGTSSVVVETAVAASLILAIDSPDPVLSLAAFDLSGGGSVLQVDFRDFQNAPVTLVDTAGIAYSSISLSIPAGDARGLAYLILNTSPDGSHPIAALPTTVALANVRCVTGQVAINTGGKSSGSAGTSGKGFDTGSGPTSTSAIQFLAGEWDRFGKVRS